MGFLERLFGRADAAAEDAGSPVPEPGAPQAPEPPDALAAEENGPPAGTVVELAEHDEADDAPADPAGSGPAAA